MKFTKYGQVACDTDGCDEPPLGLTGLCHYCTTGENPFGKKRGRPVVATDNELSCTMTNETTPVVDEDVVDPVIVPESEPLMTALFDDEPAVKTPINKTRLTKVAKTPKAAKVPKVKVPKVKPVVDDAKRAARIAASRQWHINNKAKLAAAAAAK